MSLICFVNPIALTNLQRFFNVSGVGLDALIRLLEMLFFTISLLYFLQFVIIGGASFLKMWLCVMRVWLIRNLLNVCSLLFSQNFQQRLFIFSISAVLFTFTDRLLILTKTLPQWIYTIFSADLSSCIWIYTIFVHLMKRLRMLPLVVDV